MRTTATAAPPPPLSRRSRFVQLLFPTGESLLRSDADIIPHCTGRVLEVRLHTLASPRFNRSVLRLLEHLNAAETTYPGTEFRLRYTRGDPENGVTENSGRDQESCGCITVVNGNSF